MFMKRRKQARTWSQAWSPPSVCVEGWVGGWGVTFDVVDGGVDEGVREVRGSIVMVGVFSISSPLIVDIFESLGLWQ